MLKPNKTTHTTTLIQSSPLSVAKLYPKTSLLLTFITFLLFESSQARLYRQNSFRRLDEPIHQNDPNKEEKDDNKWFIYSQTLDHFNYNPQSYTNFSQRYAINSRYWGGPNTISPIFVIAGDDWTLDTLVYGYHSFVSLASHFKALLLYIEHRYYGKSMPFGSREEAFRNSSTLGYLSSSQALADYAEVILHVKNSLKAERCPVFIIGGLYGGMLAAWFRLKYPHIAMGALASSAPILLFDDIKTQNAYFSLASKNYRDISQTCYNTIKQSWIDMDQMASSQDGLKKLGKHFNTCRLISDTKILKDYLIGKYAEGAVFASYHICDKIDNTIGNPLSKVKAGMAIFLRNCINEKKSIKYEISGSDFQSCTEIMKPISRDQNSMFPPTPFELKKYIKECEEQWDVIPRPHWTSNEFGAHNISFVLKNFASNIIFSNGLRDPGSVAGVLKSISNTLVALVTKKGGHGTDIEEPQPEDPNWLVQQRNAEIKIIEKWLSSTMQILKK